MHVFTNGDGDDGLGGGGQLAADGGVGGVESLQLVGGLGVRGVGVGVCSVRVCSARVVRVSARVAVACAVGDTSLPATATTATTNFPPSAAT